MKDAFYFSHDSNARHDLKIQALRSVYGLKGYGMYWVLVEMMRESNDYTLPINQKFAYLGLAKELDSTAEEVKQFIHDCIYQFGLFICDELSFWSDSLNRRMDMYNLKRDSNRINGVKGGRPKKQVEQIEEPVEEKPAPIEKVIEKTNQKKQVEKSIETEVEYEYCDDVMYLVNLLSSKMTENNPNCKLPSNFEKWYNEIRLMIDKDGYSFQQIDEMIRWCQEDSFWKSNILSADKLRKQAGKLILLMQKKQKPKEKSFAEEIQELMEYAKEGERVGQTTNDSVIDVDCIKL